MYTSFAAAPALPNPTLNRTCHSVRRPGFISSGPAILRGRAAGVFFHEVLGHRAEGHRQKDEDEGQTLTDMVGKRVFPSFISVYDDPTLTDWAASRSTAATASTTRACGPSGSTSSKMAWSRAS